MIANGGAAFRKRFLAVLFLALAPASGFAADACAPNATVLCLDGLRFRAEVAWTAPGAGSGAGQAAPMSDDGGSFWFFSNDNPELVVKVLDGRPVNGHFWVYYAGLSDVEYTLTVTDTLTGVGKSYHNPPGRLASRSDTLAFAGDPPAAAPKNQAALPPGIGGPSPVPLRLGPEFQVNSTSADSQVTPQVAMTPDGGFVAVWNHARYVPTDVVMEVRGRLFDASGHPRGDEFPLSAEHAGRQILPRVAADGSGRFMAVWNDMNLARARLFDADGHPLTGEMILGTGGFPDVAPAPGRGFVVAWLEAFSFPTAGRIHTQRFDTLGNLSGSGSQVSAQPGSLDSRLVLAPSPGGGFLAVWDTFDVLIDVVVSHVWAQPLDIGGQPSGNPVEAGRGGPISGLDALSAGGGFSVIWSAGAGPVFSSPEYTLYARQVTATGFPLGSGPVELRKGTWLATAPHSNALLPSGETWLLWFETGAPQDPGGGLFSRVFDSRWEPDGPALRVNTYTAGLQEEPGVAAGPGGIVAVWASGSDHLQAPYPPDPPDAAPEDGSGFGVFAQRFTPETCAADADELCLAGRFRVGVEFTDPRSDQAGTGQPAPLTGDAGTFWFFDASNVELIVKILDGRSVNGHFWVYAGALSDLAYTITVTDTATGKSKTYVNPAHRLASRADTSAF